jgi:hypothetical protein
MTSWGWHFEWLFTWRAVVIVVVTGILAVALPFLVGIVNYLIRRTWRDR